jgi:hypothetical protein
MVEPLVFYLPPRQPSPTVLAEKGNAVAVDRPDCVLDRRCGDFGYNLLYHAPGAYAGFAYFSDHNCQQELESDFSDPRDYQD